MVATGLTEMRGATAPRLLLELICARVLLPGADDAAEGVLARLDRLEKRAVDHRRYAERRAGRRPPPAAPAARRPVEPAAAPRPGGPPTAGGRPEPAAAEPAPPEPRRAEPAAEPDAGRARADAGADARAGREPEPDARRLRRRPHAWSTSAGCGPTSSRHQAPPPGRLDAPQPEPQVDAVDGTTLTLGFANAGARDSFARGGCDEVLRQAAIDVVGADWRIDDDRRPQRPGRARARPPPATPRAGRPRSRRSRRGAARGTTAATRPRARAGGAARRGAAATAASTPPREADRSRPAGRRGSATTRSPRPTPTPTPTTPTPTPAVSTPPSCSSRELGAQVIEEIRTTDRATEPARPSTPDVTPAP